jgi:hypothetical protein
LSDLANSCEYFTAEKMCNATIENRKMQANRQVKCENEEKMSCCYLCPLRPQCAISCKYLGNLDLAYVPVKSEKAPMRSILDEPKAPQETEIANNQAKYCSVCNVEMSETKTELRVDRWKGPKPTMPSADMLSVVVYLCPQCGKIEFKADRQQNKELAE